MNVYFDNWAGRINKQEDLVNKNNENNKDLSSLDKNSKSLLNLILKTNHTYNKQDLQNSYEYNELNDTVPELDISSKIAPFTTDKTTLFKKLEAERQTFLFKNQTN
jgi:hypothetical protein